MTETTTQKEEEWQRLANLISEKHDADVMLYSGEINGAIADQLIHLSKQPDRKNNIVLMLTTQGGSPDAAYRMARCLQRQYGKIILYIYGICKSAGTLISVGVNEIILSDFGEFGPLDVQLGKPDELFEVTSGLNITQALNSLNERAQKTFREILIDLKSGSRGQLTTKLASEIASNFATGLYEKMYAQIDPAQLGAIERSITIASDYGERLKTENVKKGTIDRLISRYPSHNFVIDIEEAKELFENVRMPDEEEEELAKCIVWVLRDPAKEAFVMKLNTIKEDENDEPRENNPAINEDTDGSQPEGNEDNTPSS